MERKCWGQELKQRGICRRARSSGKQERLFPKGSAKPGSLEGTRARDQLGLHLCRSPAAGQGAGAEAPRAADASRRFPPDTCRRSKPTSLWPLRGHPDRRRHANDLRANAPIDGHPPDEGLDLPLKFELGGPCVNYTPLIGRARKTLGAEPKQASCEEEKKDGRRGPLILEVQERID
uniref:Uncharacterized protein n=1 Tax=Sphaerodactylus townsendi TaxID=933632 RepID=A0ACB8G548_9SAUR